LKRKPRAKRPIEKDKPSGYDSKWEKTLHDTLLQDCIQQLLVLLELEVIKREGVIH